MTAIPQTLTGRRRGPIRILLTLFGAATVLSLQGLASLVPPAEWPRLLDGPDAARIAEVVAWYSWAPRLVVSLIAGASLGLAGALLQLALRNPLAAPSTLGVTAGAQLGLILVTLGLPGLAGIGRDVAALTGGASAASVVCVLALRRGLTPLTVILAGLIVALYLGAMGSLLLLFNRENLGSVFVWGAGALQQQGWAPAQALAWRLLAACSVVMLCHRPLGLLDIPEAGRALGVPVAVVRLTAITIAVLLSASVTAAVGVIGFIGLGAPALARLAGARRPLQRLLWSPVFGAALLWLTDQSVQALAGRGAESVPTGAATALLGGPLILLLLKQCTGGGFASRLPIPAGSKSGQRRDLACGLGLLAGATVLALLVGAATDGLALATDVAALEGLLPWRWPRVLAAASAGALFGIAGTLIQRVTGNPLASPEVTGISAGAALGLVAVIWLVPGADDALRLLAGGVGAAAVLGGIMALGWGQGFDPGRILVAGVALAAFFEATVTALLAFGDPRAGQILSWLSGSTYSIGPWDAGLTAFVAAAAFAVAPLLSRWLDLLPLGAPVMRGLGVAPGRARLAAIGLVALCTATGTLVLGPLSFVGLMAPHMARMRGFGRALPQLLAAALLGALIMVLADWLGRVVVFPRQVPAGLMAAMIGGPYLLWLMRRT